MVLQVLTLYWVSRYLLASALARKKALCHSGTYCCMFGVLLSHTLFSFLIVFNVMFRLSEKIVCFNQAYQLSSICLPRVYKPVVSSYIVYLFISFIVVKVIITNLGFSFHEPFLYYSYCISYFGPMLTISIVATLSLIAEKVFESLIEDLDRLPEINRIDYTYNLEEKMLTFMSLNTYINNISQTFGLDIFLVTTDVYLQLVLFLYTTIWSIFAQDAFPGFIWAKLAGLLEIFIIIFKLVYLCYQCDCVSRKSKTVIFKMEQLNARYFYDPDVQIILNLFTFRAFYFKINITSYGLFTIDLGLLVRIAGVVLTYFLVLVQFQVGGEMQNKDEISNTTKSECKYWPCLTNE
ncbi:gustatory receptor 68a-like [Diaphorina citri]|jgi:7tm Chemosensory receptor.|uniref:Gustatory receptor 68a-like n=1 Tax=Diaphorina citri TaxID=121845 RepID=A0A3Q0JDR8_DIACI|nr:gustatory receptor 68a-like [Diaphorina citri]